MCSRKKAAKSMTADEQAEEAEAESCGMFFAGLFIFISAGHFQIATEN